MFKLIFIYFLSLFLVYSCAQKQDPATLMSPKVENLLKYWNTGIFDDIENTLHPEFEMRMSPEFKAKKGIETFKESVTRWRSKYPDFTITVIEAIYTDHAGAGRWTMSATSEDGNKLEVMGISILHFKEGKILDEWISSSDLLWMQQLGYELNLTGQKVVQ